MFKLDERLASDTILVGRFNLSLLLLSRDANYPWFILVPERPDVTEIYQLPEADQLQLTRESAILSRTLTEEFGADKINVAALGNVVAQLHVHHIARFTSDPAWPGPIWGAVASREYEGDELQAMAARVAGALPAEVFTPAGND